MEDIIDRIEELKSDIQNNRLVNAIYELEYLQRMVRVRLLSQVRDNLI